MAETAGGGPSDRDASILAMRAAGETLETIAQCVGLTRERVRQIVSKHGGATKAQARAASVSRRQQAETELSKAIERAVLARECETFEEIEQAFSLAPGEARRLTTSTARGALHTASGVARKWSHEEVVKALKEAATYEYPLVFSKYQTLVDRGVIDGPSAVRIHQVYGGWVNACTSAGVEAGAAPRDNYQSSWTDDDLWHYVRRYVADAGPLASFRGFDQWKRETCPEAPSAPTLRNRLGQWAEIRRAVVLEQGRDDEQR